MQIEIKAAEAATIMCCDVRSVQRWVSTGKVPSRVEYNDRNRPEYYIPLGALPADAQQRYYAQHTAPVQIACAEKQVAGAQSPKRAIDTFSAAERGEIDFWRATICDWLACRCDSSKRSKADIDCLFVCKMQLEHPNVNISVDILYRKWAAVRADDDDALVDKRGKWKKGISNVPNEVLQVFNAYYLDESQHPIERCILYTQLYLQEHQPELVTLMPSYSTFRRHALALPEPVRILGRFGEKAYYDRCSPYVRRQYESIASNEWWVADTHTFDILSHDGTGTTHRIYINAYLDVRSGIFTGWYVTANPNSEATLLALRKGIMTYGIPKNIYVDNGREYLTYDIGGLGHRAKKTTASGTEKFEPPGVFKRLGINMTNAIVRNARAKLIERRFRDVKDHISRLFLTYTGGTVVEKPDRLKHVLKADKEARKRTTYIECDKVVSDKKLIEIAETLIGGYMNYQPYGGSVEEDKGKRRIDVFWAHYNDMAQRKAAEQDLNLMLMRSTRQQQIGRNGVSIPVAGKKVDFYSEDLRLLMGKKVYLRYDPECLDSVRVYDLDDRFILKVPRSNLVGTYGSSKEDIADGMRTIRKAQRITKEAVKLSTLPLSDEDSALNLVLSYARSNLDDALPPVSPNTIELVRADETPLMQAVGININIDTMTRNAARRNNKITED